MLWFRRCERGKQNKQTTFLCLIDKLLCEMDWRNPWILEAKDNARESEWSAWLTISGCKATISAAAQNTSSMLHQLLDPFSISFCIYIYMHSLWLLTHSKFEESTSACGTHALALAIFSVDNLWVSGYHHYLLFGEQSQTLHICIYDCLNAHLSSDLLWSSYHHLIQKVIDSRLLIWWAIFVMMSEWRKCVGLRVDDKVISSCKDISLDPSSRNLIVASTGGC